MRTFRSFVVLFLTLSVVLTAVYWPALDGEPVMDDQDLIFRNFNLETGEGLRRIWTDVRANPDFYPLTYTSWWLEYQAFDDRTHVPYHLANVLLHALNAALVWLVLHRGLRFSNVVAILASILFAVHPINVESVAWMSQRKNVLSGALHLLSAFLFLNAIRSRRTAARTAASGVAASSAIAHERGFAVVPYVLSLILFVLAMSAKPVTMTLAATLPILLLLRDGQLRIRDIGLALPFFALVVPVALLTTWVQTHHVGTSGEIFDMPLLHRCLLAPRVLCFYLWSLPAPVNLCFAYPRWTIDPALWWQWTFAVMAIGLPVGLWMLRRRIGLAPLLALMVCVITLSPALGLIPIYWHLYYYVADHVAYLACIPVLAVIAAGLARCSGASTRVHPGVDRTAGAGWSTAFQRAALLTPVPVVLAVLSTMQARIYEDATTIWTDTLRKTPDSFLAMTNLGVVHEGEGDVDGAIEQYQRALAIEPRFADAHLNLANVLAQQRNNPEEAVTHYLESLRYNPTSSVAWSNLSTTYSALGRHGEAIAAAHKALEIRPNFANGHQNLGAALLNAGKAAEALKEFMWLVRAKPNHAEGHLNCALALQQLGESAEAIEACQRAIAIKPELADAHYTLGLIHSARQEFPAATDAFREAARLMPGHAAVHSKMAIALGGMGRFADAVAACDRAIEIDAEHAEAHCNRGVALAAMRRLEEARGSWQRAIELDPDGEIGTRARQYLEHSLRQTE